MGEIELFALNTSRAYGEKVSLALGIPLSRHEEREFEDGEHKARPLENVRGRDVFVIQSLHGDGAQSGNDKLCRLLFFIGALRDASAARVTAVVPYLCYARKDRKSKSRDPVTTRYVAQMFEAVGADRVITLDVHNLAAFQNAFRCHTDHLEANGLFASYFLPIARQAEVTVVSPDAGGVKRAEQFRQTLSRALGRPIGSAFAEKYRSSGVLSGEAIVGDVKDRVAIILDDLISSGATIARAAQGCLEAGARRVYAAATHGLFASAANETLAMAPLERIVVTDTVPSIRATGEGLRARLAVLETAPLVAAAIGRVHDGGSIVELLEG